MIPVYSASCYAFTNMKEPCDHLKSIIGGLTRIHMEYVAVILLVG